MARKSKSTKPSVLLFNVVYEDGSLSSNRKVSSELLDDRFGEDPMDLAREAIERQDAEIAERSGVPKAKVKEVARA